jgi:lysophospholipase L1-like esterase
MNRAGGVRRRRWERPQLLLALAAVVAALALGLAGFAVGEFTGVLSGRQDAAPAGVSTVAPATPDAGRLLERSLGGPGRVADFSFGHTVDRVQVPAGERFEAGMRLPFELGVDATAFRVHVRNWEFDAEEPLGAPVTVSSIWVGEHLVTGADGMTGQFAGPPTAVGGTANLPAEGAVTDWVDTDVAELRAGMPYLLSIGFSAAASSTLATVPGLSWLSVGDGAAATAGDAGAAPAVSGALSYLDVWIEYEFAGDAPVLLAIGHSLNAPGNTQTDAHPTRGELTAWPQQWALSNDAVAISLAAPGSQTPLFAQGTEVWREFGAPAELEPDLVSVWAASNDIARGRPLADIQRDWGAIVTRVRTLWPEARIMAVTEPPRRLDAERERVRAEWNAWLSTAPYGVDRVIDADGLLRDPVDTSRLRPEVDADGIHFTELGHSLIASQLPSP